MLFLKIIIYLFFYRPNTLSIHISSCSYPVHLFHKFDSFYTSPPNFIHISSCFKVSKRTLHTVRTQGWYVSIWFWVYDEWSIGVVWTNQGMSVCKTCLLSCVGVKSKDDVDSKCEGHAGPCQWTMSAKGWALDLYWGTGEARRLDVVADT